MLHVRTAFCNLRSATREYVRGRRSQQPEMAGSSEQASTPPGATALRAVPGVFGLMLACLGTEAVAEGALPRERAFLQVSKLYTYSDFGLDYRSFAPDGSVRADLRDPSNRERSESLTLFATGLRVGKHFRLQAEYLALEDSSGGVFRSKLRLGPFGFFVPIDSTQHYRIETLRALLAYAWLNSPTLRVEVLAGATGVQANGRAVATGFLDESVRGRAAMPTLGAAAHYAGPFDTRWTLSADYSYIALGETRGQAVNIAASVEKHLGNGFHIGIGYRYLGTKFEFDDAEFDAEARQHSDGPLLSFRQDF